MALNNGTKTPKESKLEIGERFGIAQDHTNDLSAEEQANQLNWQVTFRDRIEDIAQRLNEQVVDSREKSLALTHLEEALLWTGKAIFK